MKPYRPSRIIVESAVQDSWVTRNVLQSLPGVPVQTVDSAALWLEQSPMGRAVGRAKKSLLLTRYQGRFFKHCPGGKGRLGIQNVCCNYSIINYATNCHMDCSYCYLQCYLNAPCLNVYANHLDLLNELQAVIGARPHEFFRVGTGEFADSLALDPITSYTVPLVEFFAAQPNAVLELKTKTDHVRNLIGLNHRRRTVPAWSMNPERIQRTDEHKTASIEERLAAAGACARAGYQVAFHFDPIIQYEGWEGEYRDLLGRIYRTVSTGTVAWISLGGLRMTRHLKELLRARFPKSLLPFGELVPGEDGKLRYFKPLRVEMYSSMLSWIREFDGAVPVYLCMEKPEVWQKVFGWTPVAEPELQKAICSCLVGVNPRGAGRFP
jgi:spore photoproduct lyase